MASFRPLVLALSCALWGCAAIPAQPSASICPSVVNYTPEQEAEIYRELMTLPGDSILQTVADEDHHLRAALKACRAP
jgi:hypothetical protein